MVADDVLDGLRHRRAERGQGHPCLSERRHGRGDPLEQAAEVILPGEHGPRRHARGLADVLGRRLVPRERQQRRLVVAAAHAVDQVGGGGRLLGRLGDDESRTATGVAAQGGRDRHGDRAGDVALDDDVQGGQTAHLVGHEENLFAFTAPDGAAQATEQIVDAPGLGDVVERAGLHALDHRRHFLDRRQQDDLDARLDGLHAAQDLEPAHPGHPDVEQHGVEPLLFERFESVGARHGLHDLVVAFEGPGQDSPNSPVIVDDQDNWAPSFEHESPPAHRKLRITIPSIGGRHTFDQGSGRRVAGRWYAGVMLRTLLVGSLVIFLLISTAVAGRIAVEDWTGSRSVPAASP